MDWVLFWAAAAVIVPSAGAGIKWFIDRKKDREIKSEFVIAGPEWVFHNLANNYIDFLRQLLSLDRAALGGLTDAAAGNEYVKSSVFEKSSDTWSIVVFRNSLVVGYWSCFSLSAPLLDRLINGKMFDSEISEDKIRNLRDGRGPHSLYFEMFGIHPGFRQNEFQIRRMLMVSLAQFAKELQDEQIEIAAVYANGFSADGTRLCKTFGLQPFIQSDQGGYVYSCGDTSVILGRLQQLQRFGARRIA